MTEDIQYLEERVISPVCFNGLHELCKGRLSYIGQDSVGRTMLCPCRCHDRVPTTGDKPAALYVIAWQYEHVQREEAGVPELKAWINRKVLTTSREIADDWLEAIAKQAAESKVRGLVALKAKIGDWEVIG